MEKSTCISSQFLFLVPKVNMIPTLCFRLIYVSQCNVFKWVSQQKADRAIKKLLPVLFLTISDFFVLGWGGGGGGWGGGALSEGLF